MLESAQRSVCKKTGGPGFRIQTIEPRKRMHNVHLGVEKYTLVTILYFGFILPIPSFRKSSCMIPTHSDTLKFGLAVVVPDKGYVPSLGIPQGRGIPPNPRVLAYAICSMYPRPLVGVRVRAGCVCCLVWDV